MDTVTRYLELGLRLGRHVDGLVDSYFGPAEIAERVQAEEIRPADALREDAERLRELTVRSFPSWSIWSRVRSRTLRTSGPRTS